MEGRNIPDPSLAAAYESSDQLFNVCCYAFLCNVADAIPDKLLKAYRQKESSALSLTYKKAQEPYDPKFAYGDLYRHLINALERVLVEKQQRILSDEKAEKSHNPDDLQMVDFKKSAGAEKSVLRPEQMDELDPIVMAVMVNDNFSLERAALMIADVNKPEYYQDYSELKKALVRKAKDPSKPVNKMTPRSREDGRLQEVLASYYHEMGLTGIPCLKHYAYQNSAGFSEKIPTEIRVGTQFVRTEKLDGYISAIYQRWLQIKNRQMQQGKDDVKKITHIYFHNMAKDRNVDRGTLAKVNPAILQEYIGTDKLIEMELATPNMLLVVLPADKGLMSNKFVKGKEKTISIADAKSEMLNVLQGLGSKNSTDFYISPKLHDMLFGGADARQLMALTLVEQGFAQMGLGDASMISPREQQAVYFHVMKYLLPNMIINHIDPEYVSFPCKNNIDRGGVSSSYYNLMKSIEVGKPLSESEFNQSVHAAAFLVKGRALNHHVHKLWNVINHYVKGYEARGEQLPAACAYLQRWVGQYEILLEKDELKQALIERLEGCLYKVEMASSSYNSDATLFHDKIYPMQMQTIEKLRNLLEGNDVQFTKKEMDLLVNPDGLQRIGDQEDSLPAIYRDAIQQRLIHPGRHLPDDIEMDDMKDKPRPDDAGGGSRGGPQGRNF